MRRGSMVQKAFLIFAFLLVMMIGCSKPYEEGMPHSSAYKHLLAKEEGTYSLYVVAKLDTITSELLRENGITNVRTIRHTEFLEEAMMDYKFMKLDKSPAFVVFDDKKMIYKTYNQDELIKFLKGR
jgi:hypothetical protein